MDTITTPAGQYTVPATSIVHNAQVSLTDRSPASIVHLTQYDTTMPVIAVDLTANGQPYTVPTGAAVNVRLAKPGGTYVYNPALGVSEDAQTAYIGTTVQMTTVWGRLNAIVEVVLNGAVAGTGIFILDITANPVPESAIESTSEFLTIQQIAAQVQQAADLVESQSTNLQNLTDNLAAVQNAASNALAAENASEEAKQAAQQALGFRTFFDAISPDANGSLDPSRPMTTAAAQTSWTVKSKGDRIQSVQVNGPANGLEIPVVLTGNQTVTVNLPVTEALGVGDNIQSNVPSGCEQAVQVDGSSSVTSVTDIGVVYRIRVRANKTISGTPSIQYSSDYVYLLNYDSQTEHFYAQNNDIWVFVNKEKLTAATTEAATQFFTSNPFTVWMQTENYSEENDLFVSLETHANGNVYAHDPVTLVAVPYTSADSGQTLGTYVVSSQDGTTVAVTFKAFQDGGDAATLGGMTAVEAMLNFVYPVGSIYMSANNVSPQTFLGGTWQQIQGQFLLAASSSYPAGSTGGEAEHTLTNEELPKYTNGQVYSGNTNANNVSSWLSVPEGTDMAYGALSLGGGQAHNNMPPYLAVYMWQRTA